jgi:hypothetical protein
MSTKRGDKSASMRGELAERLQREYRFQQQLARQYAGQLADAVGDDLSRCTATSGWIGKEANVPSGLSCYVARAVLDQLAGSEICDSTGDKRGNLGDKAPTDTETGQHSGEMVASQYVAHANTTQRGNTQSKSVSGATSETIPVTAQMIQLMVERGCMRGTQQVVCGFEVQWEMSVAAAVADMQAEFGWQDVMDNFREMCQVGQMCFLREMKSKAVRILGHKKPCIDSYLYINLLC